MLKGNRDNIANEIYNTVHNGYMPSESIGWPPQMEIYIKQMIIDVAEVIVNNIYDQKELEEKAENIILDDKTE